MRQTSTHMLRGVIIVGLLGALTACRGTLANGIFAHGDGLAYRVVPPAGAEWRRIDFEDNDLAWLSSKTGHMIAINATCTGYEDPPLEVLTNHLVFGFTDKEVISRAPFKLDGRDALRSIIHAKIDGMPTALELVVVKKNGCLHDFTYVSPVGAEETYRKDFEALVAGFKQERTP